MKSSDPIEASERVEAAAALVQAGRNSEAEALLRSVLAGDPGNVDAVSSLAAIALAQRDGKRAFEILAPACTAWPFHPRLMGNLGLAYMMLGKPSEAVACLERAVSTAPGDVELRLSLAQFLTGTGETRRAMVEIETVLRQEPQNVTALARLGVAAMAEGDLGLAEKSWRQALAIDAKNAEVLQNMSVLYASTGRLPEAVRLAERAYLWAPLDIEKRVQFARCLAATGEFERANAECKQVLMVAPEHLAATDLFARLTLIRGAVPAGLETLAHFVRGHPKDPAAILTLAGALRFVGRMPQALTFIDQALAIAPNHPYAQRLRTDLLLTLGRFGEVWPVAAAAPADLPRHIVVPKGTSTTDALVFGRFIPAFSAEGVTLTSFADAMVTGLLSRVAGVTLTDPADPPTSEAVPLQSLPATLGIKRETLAPADRFIDPDPDQVEKWRKRLATLPRPLIGVDWDQFPPGAGAEKIMPIAAGLGTVVSLAVDPERHQLANWPTVADAGAHIRNASDLIAAVSCMDAVIGTDGLPVHVAGALGIPGVALVACGYPWYFAAEGERSIWYRSLRVARQATPADWDTALTSGAQSLAAMLPTPATSDPVG